MVDGIDKAHLETGPGLLESTCEKCLVWEIRPRVPEVENQVALPIIDRDTRIDDGLKINLRSNARSSSRSGPCRQLIPSIGHRS